MLNEEYSLDFVGFEPDADVLHRIRIALSDIYASSPHRSFLKATFSKTEDVFEGVIDITSAVTKFAVKFEGPDIEKIAGLVFDKIKWDISSWKETRFL